MEQRIPGASAVKRNAEGGLGKVTSRATVTAIAFALLHDHLGFLLWGAPRIHGELLKLGFAVAQSTVANGMDRPCSRHQRHAESVGGF
jgi:hypothetical protein